MGWGLGVRLDVAGSHAVNAEVVKTNSTEITLELELDGDTISGHACDAGGSSRDFSGRIGLMGAIDSLIDEARTGDLENTKTTKENGEH